MRKRVSFYSVYDRSHSTDEALVRRLLGLHTSVASEGQCIQARFDLRNIEIMTCNGRRIGCGQFSVVLCVLYARQSSALLDRQRGRRDGRRLVDVWALSGRMPKSKCSIPSVMMSAGSTVLQALARPQSSSRWCYRSHNAIVSVQCTSDAKVGHHVD